jgi:AsmA protein
MRWIKRIVIGTLSVVLVLVALALIVPFLIPTSAYKDQIESRVKSATGRDLKFGGDLRLSILPSLELSARDVIFGNRPGAAEKDMARLKGLELKLRLGALLSGRFEIEGLELVEPTIVLELDKDGKANWQFDKPGTAAAPNKATPAERKASSAEAPAALPTDFFDTLQLHRLSIVRGHIVYSDARSGTKYEVSKINADISLPGAGRPFRLSGNTEYKGKRVGFSAEVKSPIEAMKGQPSAFAFEVTLDLAKVSLVGNAQADAKDPKAARVSGPLKLEARSVRDLAAWLGTSLPPGKIYGPLSLSGTVSYGGGSLELAGFAFKLDEIAATGDLRVALADVPMVSGAITIPALDLNPYMAARALAAAPPAKPSTMTASPPRPGPPSAAASGFDPAPLRLVNADLKLEARQIRAEKVHIEQAKLDVKLAGGILTVALEPVVLFKGTATGTVTVNGTRSPVSINPNFQLRGLDGNALLAAVGAGDDITGTLNAEANLTGTGGDATAIRNSLTGTASFHFANGALKGYNIAGMFRALGDIKNPLEIVHRVKAAVEALNKYDGSQRTDFSEFAASFRAANGVFATNDLRLAAPLVRVEGRGTVSLPANALDMLLAVKAVPTIKGQGSEFARLGIPIPLRAHGPFQQIAWSLDEKALADEIRKKAPDLIKDKFLKNPGDLLKKPGGILDQLRR